MSTVIVSPVSAQEMSDYLIVNDITDFKASKNPSAGQGAGILAGVDHFNLDHRDTTYRISYFNLAMRTGAKVQVTQHEGGDSDRWLLHEVENSFRRGEHEENMTPSRFRDIDGNDIFYSGLGGGTYRWVSTYAVIHIEYVDLYKQNQIFLSGKNRDTVFGVLFRHFVEIRRIKEDQVRFLASVDGPQQPFRIPIERLDFRPCLRAIDQIK